MNMNPKIFQIISKVAFVFFVILFVSAIFIKNQRVFIGEVLIVLFFIVLILEGVYQSASGLEEVKISQKKKKEFKKLPKGNYKIKDKDSNDDLGILTAEEINYLREKFLDNGMDDNNFYFDSKTLELFENENPPQQLHDKIKKMLKMKEQIEIVWEK